MRESILSSCDEFNHGHFFMLVQFGILVYYPSIALSIVYQSYEQEIDDEQTMGDILDNYEDAHMQQPQPQPQSQSIDIQTIVDVLQRIISEMMQKQQQLKPFMTEQQQQYATKRAIQMMPKEEKKGGDDERFIVRLQGGQTQEGGQEKLVWTTVYIQL